MDVVFLKIANMSIAASWLVLVVLVLRRLLQKAPRWVPVLLWGMVGIRLICPFTIQSTTSLIPSAETFSPQITMERTPEVHTGISFLNDTINPILSTSMASAPEASANPLQIWIPILASVWICGILVLLLYMMFSYGKLHRKVRTAVLLRDHIYQSESVISPFVLGIVNPKIYLPFFIEERDAEHVIAHEQAHIRRKDHIWKPIAFLALTIHWFNPLIWFSYILFCRDLEHACDEKVVKEWDVQKRADYSQALLSSSINHRTISVSPLSFGEVSVKERVKSVLYYKKPAFWMILICAMVSIVVGFCFLTNPIFVQEDLKTFLNERIMEYYQTETSQNYACCMDYEILGTKKEDTFITVYMWVLYQEYSYHNGELKEASGAHVPTVITVKAIDSEEKYELVEYWEPRDGSYYVEDLKQKFPWYLYYKTIEPQVYMQKQSEKCEQMAKDYYSFIGENIGNSIVTYEETPKNQIYEKVANDELLIYKTHSQMNNGTWYAENYYYRYRLEITGKMNNAAKSITYIVLSNRENITFEETWKADGYGSLSTDYFEPGDAVIVASRMF